MAFKMKGFSGFKQKTSPVGELLGMFEDYTKDGGPPRGTIEENGKKRDMTPGEIASQRYITKTVRDKVPEEHRADFNYQLSKGRLDGDTLEDQAQALHKTMSSPAKQKTSDGLPEGFYNSYKSTDQKNVDGKKLDMQQTKAASVKSGKFVAVYS